MVWGVAAVASSIMLKDLTLNVHSDLGLHPVKFVFPSIVVFSVAGLCLTSVCLNVMRHRIEKRFIAATLLLILAVKAYDVAVTFQIGFSRYDWVDPSIVVIVILRIFYLIWRKAPAMAAQ